MSAAPLFYTTPRYGVADCSASANAIKLYATADNLVLVVTGAASPGSLIEKVLVRQTGVGASTANNIARFYLYDGTGYTLVQETNLGASVTSSATVAGPGVPIPELIGLKLPDATWKLYVGFSVAGTGANVNRVTAQVVDA